MGDKKTAIVPVRATVCGLPGALSVMLTAALRVPATVGVNVTLTWQLSLGARVGPQVLVSAKSLALAPTIPMLDSVSVAIPVFVSVAIWGELVVPTACGPKVRLTGRTVSAGNGSWPRKMRVCQVKQLLDGIWQLLVPV